MGIGDTYRFGDKLIGAGVELESGLHLELVSDFDLAVLTGLEASVDFLSSTDPKHLEFNLVGTVPQE